MRIIVYNPCMAIDKLIDELENSANSMEELADYYRQFSDERSAKLARIFVGQSWSIGDVIQRLKNIKNNQYSA